MCLLKLHRLRLQGRFSIGASDDDLSLLSFGTVDPPSGYGGPHGCRASSRQDGRAELPPSCTLTCYASFDHDG